MAFRSWVALACVLASLSLASAEKTYMKADLQGKNVVAAEDAQVLPSGTVGSGFATLLLDTEAKTLTYKVHYSLIDASSADIDALDHIVGFAAATFNAFPYKPKA
ncbi:hypothetical protein T484DRAFT_1868926 [Baffinella frigidus]|nr:hypothetical protein T484DRAFT_1868926 [Cryptophyta sp. CCMP2293]